MHGVRTRAPYRGFAAVFIFLLMVCCPSSLFAQSKLAARLPANTIAYFEWKGGAGVLTDVAKNHLLQLALDPQLTPLWGGLTQEIQSSSQNAPDQKSKAGPALGLADVVSLLSNPMVAGAVELRPRMTASATGKHPQAQHVGVFLVYDASGKADLIQKLKAASAKSQPWTSYDFGGTQVEWRSTETKTGTNSTYRAQAGNYYLVSDQKTVIEELVGRFGLNGETAASLGERPEFQEVQKYILPSAAVEFYLRLPDFSRWVSSPGEPPAQMLAGLHLEKIHAAGGSLSFAGEATEMRAAILGDASAGGPFDFAGESRAGFVTEPLAKMGPVYGASRLNWAGGYQWLEGALGGNLDPKQAATLTMAQAMAQAFLGMPIADALKLFTGETASVTSYSADDGAPQQLYAIAIQKPEAVLRILRAVGGKMIVAEDSAGNTTFLDLAYPYRDPVSGTQRRKFYYVAVSPDMLMVAPRKAMLRQAAILLTSKGTAPAGPLANPEVQQLRMKLPEKLTALGATDLTQIPWDKVAANIAVQMQESAKKQPGPASGAGASPGSSAAPSPAQQQAIRLLKSIPPDVVSRHVHVSVGGWWKDANGVYVESYIQ